MSAQPISLSPRQRQVFEGLARGLTVVQIAENLSISRSMIDIHIRGAKTKLGAITREQALALSVKHRLISM